ncbi:MAG: precorrin-6A synthase (deacetylating) [Boseongicola sp.]|nr:MAG: precorrin-6A synthase (deacetylating) [Boseongicola sp.]
MAKLSLIGIASGNPDHLTGQARRAIQDAELILVPSKGPQKSDLADLRLQIVDALRPGEDVVALFNMPKRRDGIPYLEAVDLWHDEIANIWAGKIADHEGVNHVALLVWGDPSLYDSTLRIASRISPAPEIEVVPGLTSLQLLTAVHAIPLNDLGKPVMITTGRQLTENGWPEDTDCVAVMLDGDRAFRNFADQDVEIWWGAYLGMPNEILKSGVLKNVSAEINETRTRAREQHGWIMDIYLMRRMNDA